MEDGKAVSSSSAIKELRSQYPIRSNMRIITILVVVLLCLLVGLIIVIACKKTAVHLGFLHGPIVYLGGTLNTHTDITKLCRHDTERCAAPVGSHPCCVEHLAQIVAAVTRLLGRKAFIVCGTLLAFRRYDGKHMIPFDDDADMAILAEHEPDFVRAIPILKEKGYVVTLNDLEDQGSGLDPSRTAEDAHQTQHMKYPPCRYYDIRYSATNSVHVDIALLCTTTLKDGSRLLVDAPQWWADTLKDQGQAAADKYKTWVWPEKYILPVHDAVHLGQNVFVPHDVDGFLTHEYGKSFLVPYDRGGGDSAIKPVGHLMRELPPSSNAGSGLGPIYIVNLETDPERRHHLLKQLEEEQLYATVGGECGVLASGDLSRFTLNGKWNRDLGPNEKKCFLSHEACWEKIAHAQSPGLILEDDASLPYGFSAILKRITTELSDFLENPVRRGAGVCVRLGRGSTAILKPAGTSVGGCLAFGGFETGSWAYILTPRAAQMLIEVSSKGALSWPVDHFATPPPLPRDPHKGEDRLPDDYILLEVDSSLMQPLKFRYSLPSDGGRNLIVQELSTDMKNSRSS